MKRSADDDVSESLDWRWRRFDDLGVRDLQHIYAARQRVFAIEQACIYLDVDGCDAEAFHLAAWSPLQAEPLAYARVLDPGVKYAAEVSIGRVLTVGRGRGRGLGRELVARSIAAARHSWPGAGIRISAQSRLERFYQGFGFVVVGAHYLEDGIEHTEMLLEALTA
jgi:ElaA protein